MHYTKNVVLSQVLPPPPTSMSIDEETAIAVLADDIVGDDGLMEELIDSAI